MRIAFVSWEFPPQFGGGIGTYVAAMSCILAQRGHQVRVVTVSFAPFPSRETINGVEVIRLPLRAGHGPEPVGSLRGWQARSDAVYELLSHVQDLDIIEFADYRGEGVTFLTSVPPDKRPTCVVKLHTALNVLNRYNPSRVRFPVLEHYEEQALLAADRLVSPSQALIRETQSLVRGVGPIDLLPYPADPAFLRSPAKSDESAEEVLYVGRLEERKGVETLIRAAPTFLNACPGAVLHLVGGDLPVSSEQPSMKARLLEMLPRELRPRVVFDGSIPREQLISRYLRARVCVFPSHFENFPNTCLEAMSLGRPVIGTDNSGMAEMIEDGVSGCIVRAADVEHLSETLIDLYQRPSAQRLAIGQAAHTRMREQYHPDVVAERFEQLYAGYYKHSAAAEHVRVTSAADQAQPVVTVVIPCYNHGQYLLDALESVRNQDWPRIECLVVDDGSTDRATIERLADLERKGLHVIRQANQGLAAARNIGVLASSSPFYVPLDADDKLAPTFISRLIRPLLAKHNLGYCYSHAQFFGAASGVWACEPYDPHKLMVQNLSVATALVRRKAFDEVGGYSRDMIYGFEDWDFWLALLAAGYHGHCVPEPLFLYRKHPPGQSMLANTQRHRAEMVQQMVQHHRTLFASMLDVAIREKDTMFFSAHMEAHQLRQAIASGEAGGSVVSADPVYQELLAQAQLESIENSNSWRVVQRMKYNPLYRLFAHWQYGSDWQTHLKNGSPSERLDRILRSRSYRAIQALKRTSLHRWYARRKYGNSPGEPA